MKQVSFLCLAATMALTLACSDYDDSALTSRIDNLDSRVAALEQTVQKMNSDITALQTAVRALQSCDFVTSVEKLADGSGYTINFSQTGSITIYNGKDGVDGTNGKDGAAGKDGADGHTPVISVQLIDGQYYWTVDGELLKDGSGNNVPAGKDGITPKVRVNEGYWEVSYDDGQNWTRLGLATETVTTSCTFSGVSQDDDTVTLTLTEGGSIVLPKAKTFTLSISTDDVAVFAGETVKIPYTITGYVEGTTVGCMGNNGYNAAIEAGEAGAGNLSVSVPDPVVAGNVIIFADNNKGNSSVKMLCFEEGSIEVVAEASAIPAAGGSFTATIVTNLDYDVVIPDEATWISRVETKALRSENIEFSVAANPSPEARAAVITFQDRQARIIKTVAVGQEGNASLGATLSGRAHSFGVNCDEGASNVAYDCDWLTATLAEGSPVINIVVNANTTGSQRTAKVTYQLGADTRTLTFVQNALPVGCPVADLFDALYLADGTAVDVSAAGRDVTTWTGTYLNLATSPYGWSPDFTRVNNGKAYATDSAYGFPIDSELNTALADGFTMEAVYTASQLVQRETKFFSSTASGGIALMTNKTTDNMLFLLYVGAWKIVDAGFAPEIDKFYHIVGTWDGEKACVYVDGELMNTMEVSGTLKMGTKSPNWVVIGANENTVDASGNLTYLNGHWTGMVPVARIYDKALTAEEVKASYDIDTNGIVLQ